MGQFQLLGDVYPQLYIPQHEQSYYYKKPDRSMHIGFLVEEILSNIDPYVNYADYDNLSPNGYTPDAVVDMIFICFRFFYPEMLDYTSKKYSGICGLTGYAQEFGGGKKSITLDGKTIWAYCPDGTRLAFGTLQHEVLCPHKMGIILPEYGHWLFGLVHYERIGWGGLWMAAHQDPCAPLRGLNWVGLPRALLVPIRRHVCTIM